MAQFRRPGSLLPRKSSGLLPTVSSDPTTAISFGTVAQADFINSEDSTQNDGSHSAHSNISVYNSDESDDDEIQNLLLDLMVHENVVNSDEPSFLEWDILHPQEDISSSEFLDKYVSVDRNADEKAFHEKLKHFFILSSAGKPIYSTHGLDDVILGYMGLITTIVSTFQENMAEDFRSVSYGGSLKVLVVNKDPLLFVAVSRIQHELVNDLLLVKQLETLYDYLVSVLSRPHITKNFQNRMNYDLRRVLTPLDFHNFDMLCLRMTYGYDMAGFDFKIGEMLGSAMQCFKLTNTTRTKLGSTLLSLRKLKENDEYIANDLLFAILCLPTGKVISLMRLKAHELANEDLKILFSTVANATPKEDLWVPLCLPHFNANGFLYVFVRRIQIAGASLVVILISGNKNNFFHMQKLADSLVAKLHKLEGDKRALSRELSSERLSILHEIKVPVVKHFIYKLKTDNQFIMSDLSFYNGDSLSANTIFQLVYFYSTLYYTKSSTLSVNNTQKKLTYVRWLRQGTSVTGFMLTDSTYEFYCLCNELVRSQDLIGHSLRIIRWCSKYRKRLFIGGGVSF